MIDVLTATDMALEEIRKHSLPVVTLEITPGSPTSHKYDWHTKDYTRPVLPQVSLRLFGKPAGFLAWCEHLDAERIWVKRRDLDTCLHANVDLYGLCWSMNSLVSRPDAGPHLPGVAVAWERQPSGRAGNEAVISLQDLRVALTALGVLEVSGV